MPYNASDAIKAASDDKSSVFQDAIGDILADKLRERIGVQRVVVAQSLFNDTEDEAPEELETEIDGESDEDV